MKSYKHLFQLDPAITFLNHGSFGATPKPVFEIYQSWQRRLEQQPVLFLGRSYHQLIHHARTELASYLGTGDNNLVFVPNATYAVNQIARSLQLQPGDEVLTSDHEYGACNYTWEFICKKAGAVYKHQSIPFPADDEEIIDIFWNAVTRRTKLIFLSHISSPTALRFPVEEICMRARRAGILTLIDGAHAPGQLPLNLDSIQADFYTGNCHKWMLAPKGAGFLFASPQVQHLVEPMVVSWGFQDIPDYASGSRFVDMLTWSGTHDPAAYLTVPVAIQFLNEYQWETVRTNCHQLLQKFLPKFNEITGKDVLYCQDHQFIQMADIELPAIKDITGLKTTLYEQFQIEVPLIEWNNRHMIRISMQGYNTEQDLFRLLDALGSLLPKYKLE